MKVLGLNSSPRVGADSKTEWMLDHLLQGMADAGAAVEAVALKDRKIKLCRGCFTCWTKTPGTCILKDDMTSELLPKWMAADLVVYASPLYHYTLNAQMKGFIERTLPILEPFLEEGADNRTDHSLRCDPPAAVVLSVAGFPEMAVFDHLSAYARFLFRETLWAEIYRPAAESITGETMADKRDAVAAAVRRAGAELIENGGISDDTMQTISQPLGEDKTVFHTLGNLFWKTCIQEKVTPKEFQEKEMTPRPDSLETYMLIMQLGFNPGAARELAAVMQFTFSGSVTGQCYLSIENGAITAAEGLHPSPQLTIEAPFDIWMDIITGKADGQEMFMQQRYRVEGDFNLLMKLGTIFGR